MVVQVLPSLLLYQSKKNIVKQKGKTNIMDTQNKTILIVDDDQDCLNLVKFHCERFGFNTITAESQKECEEIIETQKPDLAIFDLMMENDDSGFILSYKLKKKYPDVPVILATAASSVSGYIFELENETDKSWMKADVFMEKNIRPDQLHREINKLLKL
ncbi:MAG: response regulator [Bacteroidales bacterium]|nr:response regulator [Bacteroidales bacterium]